MNNAKSYNVIVKLICSEIECKQAISKILQFFQQKTVFSIYFSYICQCN